MNPIINVFFMSNKVDSLLVLIVINHQLLIYLLIQNILFSIYYSHLSNFDILL